MLLSFSRAGALPVGKMGERLQVHPASVTNAVDRLERDGYVARRSNPADGRGVLAEITAAGRALADAGDGRAQREVVRRRCRSSRRRAAQPVPDPPPAAAGLRRFLRDADLQSWTSNYHPVR